MWCVEHQLHARCSDFIANFTIKVHLIAFEHRYKHAIACYQEMQLLINDYHDVCSSNEYVPCASEHVISGTFSLGSL